MSSISRHLRPLVVVGVLLLLVGGCSDSSTPAGPAKPVSSAPAPTASASASAESAKQHYLDQVNALCDTLLPKVIRATHGGSLDITAQQYLRDWPPHHQVLMVFDKSLAAVSVPDAAKPAAVAMQRYVAFADKLDAARLKAAKQGESAWRHEVAAEANVESAPAITRRTAAGFAPSCDAR